MVVFDLLLDLVQLPLDKHWDQPVEQNTRKEHDGDHSGLEHVSGYMTGGIGVYSEGGYECKRDSTLHHS